MVSCSDPMNLVFKGILLSLLEDICCLSLLPSKITFQFIETAVHLTTCASVRALSRAFKHMLKSLWYQEDFKEGLTVSTCLRALIDAHRWLSQFWASSLLFVSLLGQNLLLNHSSGRGTRAAPSPKALCASLPVPPACCLRRTLQLHSVPALSGLLVSGKLTVHKEELFV